MTRAEELYRQGGELRRRGDFAGAINCYAAAARLDPGGPAPAAKAMLDDIMAFRNGDAYNP